MLKFFQKNKKIPRILLLVINWNNKNLSLFPKNKKGQCEMYIAATLIFIVQTPVKLS